MTLYIPYKQIASSWIKLGLLILDFMLALPIIDNNLCLDWKKEKRELFLLSRETELIIVVVNYTMS